MGPELRLVQGGALPTSDKGVTAIVRIHVRDGCSIAFEAIARALAAKVMADEPLCLSFAPTRVMGSGERYVVVGRWRSWAGLEAHWKSAHLAAANAEGRKITVGAPELELYEDL